VRRIEGDFRRSAVNLPEDLSFGLVFLILGALIGLGACGSGHSNSTDNGAGQTRTVTGTEVVSYVTETGTVDIPDDLSKTTITAYVPKTSGGYDAIIGSGTSDGHFVIPEVVRDSTYCKSEAATSGRVPPRSTQAHRCRAGRTRRKALMTNTSSSTSG